MSAEEITTLLRSIDSRLQSLEARVEKIEKSSQNMDSHIDFVEGLYETIKSPFHTLMDLVSYRAVLSDTEQKQIMDK